MTEKKEVALRTYSVDKIKDMTGMAIVLKDYVVKQKLYTEIQGKNYAHVEGWQFAGGLMGLFPRVAKVENLSIDKEIKWKADVEIVELKTGKVMSNGFSVCSSLEVKKKNADEYVILSMAQTRAIGKAYRNLIGWVMKLAGYESTPSEEMTSMNKEKQQTDKFDKVKTMVAGSTSVDALNVYLGKLNSEKSTFTLAQKNQISKIVKERISQLQK